MKKIIPGLLSMLLCLGMATGCDAVKEKLPDVKLPGFLENILGKESASSEEDTASESTPDSSTPDDSSEEPPALHAHEQDLKDVKEYLQGIVNEIALETRKNFTLINSYSFFGETAKYDIAWSVNVDGVTVQEGEKEDTIVIGELEEDTPYVLTATITDPEGCHNVVVEFDAIALKAEQVVPEKITAAPAENTAYKLHMYQVSKAQDLYFTGVMSGFYLATTNASKGETYENGIDVYAEKVEGKDAYYLTFTNPEGKKQYIGVTNTYNNGSYHDNVILADSTEVAAEGDPTTFEFAWSNDYKTMVATLSGVKSGGTQDTTETKTTTYFLGTSGSYYTFGACPVEEAAESYVGCLVQMVNKADVAAEDKVAAEKDALNITTAFSGDVSEELPTKGSTYSDVAITWAVKSGDATITENVLTVVSPAADTTIVLTATFTCGDASVTKDVEINVFPKSVVTEVTNPEENTAYAFYLYQANKAKNYYFTGKMDGNFLATTDDPAKAADVYAEKSGNGFMIYVLDASGAKSYIKLTEYKKNETDKYYKASVALSAEGSVFTLNTQFGMWVCNTGNDVFYLGTYNDFTTISSSAASYVKVDNAGVTQFIAKFGIIDESALPPAGGETPDAPELPADGSTLTIDEVLALTYTGDTTNKYYVTGTVKEVYNTTYGNMYITDEDGTELTVYGTYNADGTLRFDAMDAAAQPKAGDIVKFYSILSSYNGKNQLKNAWIMEVTPGQGGSEGGNEGEGETPSTPSEVVKATGDSFTIESYATANAWADSTLYPTVEHEFYTVSVSATTPSSYGQNTGKYYVSDKSWRMYQADTTSIVFTAVEGKTIATIKITYISNKTGVLTLNGANVASDEVVNVNASTITFSVGNTSADVTNGQARITAIEVLFAEEAPATYTLSLMNGNPKMGGTLETFELTEGAALELPTLTGDGKNFLGWFAMDDNGELTVAAPATMPADVLALYAVWEVTAYTVTFVNGEETTSVKFGVEYDFANGIEATVNDLTYVLADNLPKGYMFQEMVPETFELKDYTFTIVEIPPTLYTLTLVNGENPRVPGAVTTSELVEGATLELPVLEAEGKTFKGWYLVDLATGMPSEEAPKIMPAAALTLKAVWEYEIYTLTIVNGEESTEFKFAVEYNGDIMIKVTDLAYVLAKNLPEGYIWLEEVPETFELKNYTFTAHKHAYAEKVVSPTCTTDGYTNYTCGCGDTYDVAGETALGHADEDNNFKCDNCSTIVEPEADSVLTLDEAIALGKLYAHNTYTTNKYYVTATIADIYNTSYGNANVYAEDGTKFVIYGMYSYDGSLKYEALEAKPGAGDEVTVYGIIGNYSGTPQMKNGWIDDFIVHEHDYSEVVTAPTCTTDGYTTVTCSICKASSVKDVVTALGHTTEAGTCERCEQEIGGDAVVAQYEKVTSASEFTTGTYVLVVNTKNVTLSTYDNGWITGTTLSNLGNTIDKTQGDSLAITLEVVSATGVKIKLGSTYIKPKSGNSNGIQTGDYTWTYEFQADGTIVFKGTGSDTTTLAYNADAQYLKFRAYKNTTVAGNASGYPSKFTAYKLVG